MIPISTPVALIRHGPTEWNAERRIQGTVDTPLSEMGREWVGTWRLPKELAGFQWFVSPRQRAQETARLLGVTEAEVDPRLAEMAWGEWEGRRIEDLRAEFGDLMTANEGKGLDFRPPKGESPRDVQARLSSWFREVAESGRPTAAVAHAGVIRAAFALASGWDMTGKPPVKLLDGMAHLFRVGDGGVLSIDRLNISLEPG